MSEYFVWKDPSEQLLRTEVVDAGGVQFRTSSYYSGHPIYGIPVPCKIAGSILDLSDDQVAAAKKVIAAKWILPHPVVVGVYCVADGTGNDPSALPLGAVLSLIPLETAIAKGYCVFGSPAPSVSDRLSQAVTA